MNTYPPATDSPAIESLSPDQMYKIISRSDASYDGSFYVGVKTTGIFCRPSCHARTPNRANVEFFREAAHALAAGYRPCKLCRPIEPPGATPAFVLRVLRELQAGPNLRFTDADIAAIGIDPTRVRRWFKRTHGMTFQAYQRLLRINYAHRRLARGAQATTAAFDSGYESLSGFNAGFKRTFNSSPTKSRSRTVVHTTRIETPLGPMVAAADKAGVLLLEFADRRGLEKSLSDRLRKLDAVSLPGSNAHLSNLERELSEYFKGTLREFSVPLRLIGTEFEVSAWRALQTVPYGETRSYSQQAQAIAKPTAVRAVARANGKNCIAIVIPCHRIIGADGKLVGYGGGLERKRRLLALEVAQRSSNRN